MNTFSLIMLAAALSIDGFWGGFAFGLKKVRISIPALLVITACTVAGSMATMFFGHYLKGSIPMGLTKLIGAAILVVVGISALKKARQESTASETARYSVDDLLRVIENPLLADLDKNNDISIAEAIMIGVAFALDASVAAFTVALAGGNYLTVPCLFGFVQFLLIGIGNMVAARKASPHIKGKLSYMPGLVLIILGLIRLH